MTLRYTTINCIRIWRDYAVVGPAEIVRNVVPACVRAGALAIPLALPGAVPALPYGGALYDWPRPLASYAGGGYGSAFAPFGAGGALLAPGVFGVSPQLSPVRTAVNHAGWWPEEAVGSLPASTTGGYPVTTHTPGLTEIQPMPVDVDEPAGWAVMLVAVAAVLGWRRWM